MKYDASLSMILGHEIYTQGVAIYLEYGTNHHLIGSLGASTIKQLRTNIEVHLA